MCRKSTSKITLSLLSSVAIAQGLFVCGGKKITRRLHFNGEVSFRSTEINTTVKQIKTPCPTHLGLGMQGMLGKFPSIPLWYLKFSPLPSPHVALLYWWLTITLNLILPNLSGIESASGEDSSGIEPASGEDESGEDESGIESGSGAGMFWLFDYFLSLWRCRFLKVDFVVIKTPKNTSNNQTSKDKVAP